MKKTEKEFIRGLALAAAIVGGSFGETTMAQKILGMVGFTRGDLVEAEVDPSDINNIFYGDPDGHTKKV